VGKLNIFCCDIHSERKRNAGRVISALRHFVDVFEQALYPLKTHTKNYTFFLLSKLNKGLYSISSWFT